MLSIIIQLSDLITFTSVRFILQKSYSQWSTCQYFLKCLCYAFPELLGKLEVLVVPLSSTLSKCSIFNSLNQQANRRMLILSRWASMKYKNTGMLTRVLMASFKHYPSLGYNFFILILKAPFWCKGITFFPSFCLSCLLITTAVLSSLETLILILLCPWVQRPECCWLRT